MALVELKKLFVTETVAEVISALSFLKFLKNILKQLKELIQMIICSFIEILSSSGHLNLIKNKIHTAVISMIKQRTLE